MRARSIAVLSLIVLLGRAQHSRTSSLQLDARMRCARASRQTPPEELPTTTTFGSAGEIIAAEQQAGYRSNPSAKFRDN